MKNLSREKIVKSCILFAISLMFLLTLCFNIFKVSYQGEVVKDNGFTLLDFKTQNLLADQAEVLGTISIFILIFSLIFIILSVSNLFLNEKFEEIFVKVLIPFVLAFSLLYLFAGEFYTDFFKTASLAGVDFDTKTAAFVPFIIQIILITVYLVYYYVFANKAIKNVDKQDNDSIKLNKEMQVLVTYKQMLDNGLITNEDFETIKKDMLGGGEEK